jgi:hypothetical protein
MSSLSSNAKLGAAVACSVVGVSCLVGLVLLGLRSSKPIGKGGSGGGGGSKSSKGGKSSAGGQPKKKGASSPPSASAPAPPSEVALRRPSRTEMLSVEFKCLEEMRDFRPQLQREEARLLLAARNAVEQGAMDAQQARQEIAERLAAMLEARVDRFKKVLLARQGISEVLHDQEVQNAMDVGDRNTLALMAEVKEEWDQLFGDNLAEEVLLPSV